MKFKKSRKNKMINRRIKNKIAIKRKMKKKKKVYLIIISYRGLAYRRGI